jgi:hypothetical protein
MARRLLILLAFALAAGGASALPAGAQSTLPPATPDPSIADGSAQRALVTARARWSRLKIRSYDYEVKTTCFCRYTGFRSVKVRNGLASKRSKAATPELASVGRLFRVIQRAIDAKAHKLAVRYGARGVPVEVFMDSIQYVADDEWGFDVRRFRRR